MPNVARVQDRDIHALPSGQESFVELVPAEVLEAIGWTAIGADARISPIMLDAYACRDIPWSEMVERTHQEDFGPDWTLPGPRMAVWCQNYLPRQGLGSEGHHEHPLQICKFGAADGAVQELCQPCQQIKAATCQDGVDGTDLISIEMKAWKLLTVDYAHWDKAKELESEGVGGMMSLEEQSAFSGLSRLTSSVMVSPELIEFVRSNFEKKAELYKSMRLARVLRESRRNDG